jgi:hypothetical protein
LGRAVAPELLKRNVPTTLISDNMTAAVRSWRIAKLCFFMTA